MRHLNTTGEAKTHKLALIQICIIEFTNLNSSIGLDY
jgi:hypothetical protein